jgi:Phospholipase D Active site motif
VPGFDITSLLDFNPPRYICPACRGLMRSFKSGRKKSLTEDSCPICEVKYDVAIEDDSPGWDERWNVSTYDYFKKNGLLLDHADLLTHATRLAEVVRESRGEGARLRRDPWPTMRTFFEVVSRARYFVHFCSWGISHQFVGALKMASARVPVYGFASNVEPSARVELTEYPTETPGFIAKVIPSEQNIYDAPHQKMLIVDGLVAFKGSANLTNAGVRRADRGLDLSETVTDYADVTKLNNTLFAPVWRRITAPGEVFYADYCNPDNRW